MILFMGFWAGFLVMFGKHWADIWATLGLHWAGFWATFGGYFCILLTLFCCTFGALSAGLGQAFDDELLGRDFGVVLMMGFLGWVLAGSWLSSGRVLEETWPTLIAYLV